MPDRLRVALITTGEKSGGRLRTLLEDEGVKVPLQVPIAELDPEDLDRLPVCALLVNLDETSAAEIDALEQLVERSEIPILFNEDGIHADLGWVRRLIAKLALLVEDCDAAPRPEPVLFPAPGRATAPAPSSGTQPTSGSGRKDAAGPETLPGDASLRLWVLGASLGGPQAVKRFLAALPADVPAAFLLAQHIGAAFVPLLAEQLQRATPLDVRVAGNGDVLQTGRVLVVPVEHRLRLGTHGRIRLTDETIPGSYRPSIDDVMREAAEALPGRAHAIVFSGMGEDGALGVRRIHELGGTVFAQNADSSVISSMPDAARREGVVSFSGDPEALAERVVAMTERETLAPA